VAQRKRVTIRDVAAQAGVSIQTVSRVVNNRPDVAPETFQRVQAVINQTGYAPNMLARGLTQGRSHVLGVVAYGLEYFGPSRVVTAIERQATEMGYGVSLNLILEPESSDVDRILDNLRSRQVDGIIWAIPEVGDNRGWAQTKGSEMPVPVLMVGGMAGQPNLPSIGIDNAAIGRLATEYLIEGGARSVGIITGPLTWWEATQRLQGWRSTMQAHGRPASDLLVEEGDWTVTSGEAGAYRLLQRCPATDAVFASNDSMALGVLYAAHRLGRRVPDDLAVIGVDNVAEGSHFWPPLTTVDQPLSAAGVLAVKEIDALIRRSRQFRKATVQEPAPTMTLLMPQLVVRESARPPLVSKSAAASGLRATSDQPSQAAATRTSPSA
jgi:LacI family transcriptional regulator